MPSILEFLRTRRTYRRFLPKPVPDAVLREALEAARIASCGSNRQTLKYALVQSPAAVAEMNRLVRWAAYLPPAQGYPKAGETPTAFIAVFQDESLPGVNDTDAGLALGSLTAAAWAYGVGSCIMGNIDRAQIKTLLGLSGSGCGCTAWWRWATRPTRAIWCRCGRAAPPITWTKTGTTACPSAR